MFNGLKFLNYKVLVNNKIILDNINLEFKFGNCYGLIGPNGAGKSSFIFSILGLKNYRNAGKIYFCNKDITNLKPWEKVKLGIFVIFQEFPKFKSLIPSKIFWIDEKYIDILKIEEFLEKPLFKEMSHGEKKRLDLAITLSLKPKVLFLDEIDSGVDIDSLNLIYRALETYKKENKNVTYIFVSHTFKILKKCEKLIVYLVKDGKIRKISKKDLIMVEKYGYERF